MFSAAVALLVAPAYSTCVDLQSLRGSLFAAKDSRDGWKESSHRDKRYSLFYSLRFLDINHKGTRSGYGYMISCRKCILIISIAISTLDIYSSHLSIHSDTTLQISTSDTTGQLKYQWQPDCYKVSSSFHPNHKSRLERREAWSHIAKNDYMHTLSKRQIPSSLFEAPRGWCTYGEKKNRVNIIWYMKNMARVYICMWRSSNSLQWRNKH